MKKRTTGQLDDLCVEAGRLLERLAAIVPAVPRVEAAQARALARYKRRVYMWYQSLPAKEKDTWNPQ